jgi:hypothetical protein
MFGVEQLFFPEKFFSQNSDSKLQPSKKINNPEDFDSSVTGWPLLQLIQATLASAASEFCVRKNFVRKTNSFAAKKFNQRS